MGSGSAADSMNILVSGIAGALAGLFAAMGLGGGGILIIYLTLIESYPQNLAQGINLIFFVPIAAVAVILYAFKNLINWKIAIKFAILGVAGAVIGSQIAGIVNGYILSKLFGVLLLIMGILQLKNKNR